MHDCPDCGKPCQCTPGNEDPDDCVHDCEQEDEDEEDA
jgi:hypothetical protein